MASVRLNCVFEEIRGKIGDMVFKHYGDGTIVARMPHIVNPSATDAQKAVRARFREAAWYGKTVMADPQARAKYEEVAKSKKKPLFSLIVEDFLRVPSVDEIDLGAYSGQAGEKIFVRASDDVDVVSVHVTISKVTGESIESGAAVKTAVDPGRWTYTTTASVAPGTPIKVEVGATDRPGHTGTKTETQ